MRRFILWTLILIAALLVANFVPPSAFGQEKPGPKEKVVCSSPDEPGLCPTAEDMMDDAPAGLKKIKIRVCRSPEPNEDGRSVEISCYCRSGEKIVFPPDGNCSHMVPENIRSYCLRSYICGKTAEKSQSMPAVETTEPEPTKIPVECSSKDPSLCPSKENLKDDAPHGLLKIKVQQETGAYGMISTKIACYCCDGKRCNSGPAVYEAYNMSKEAIQKYCLQKNICDPNRKTDEPTVSIERNIEEGTSNPVTFINDKSATGTPVVRFRCHLGDNNAWSDVVYKAPADAKIPPEVYKILCGEGGKNKKK